MSEECNVILDKLRRKWSDLQVDMDDIGNGIDVATSNAVGMYMILDELQDVRDYLIVAKMFGCMRS